MQSDDEIIGHIVNLPLLNSFFNESEITQFSGNTMTKLPVEIKVPNLNLFSSNYTDDIELLTSQSLSLNKMANKSKNNEIMFESLAHKLTYDLKERKLNIVSAKIEVFSYQFIMLCLTTILSIGLTLIVFLLHNKIKSITLALCIIQRLQAKNARLTSPKPIVFDFFLNQATAQTTNTKMFIPEVSTSVELLDILLISIIIAFVSYIIYKSYRLRNFGHQFAIYAEIGNDTDYVKIKLTTLRHTPNLYKFIANRFLSTITVTGSLHPRMQLDWQELEILNTCTHMRTKLKHVYNISFYQQYKLSTILADEHYFLMFTKGPDKMFNLIQLTGCLWEHIQPNQAHTRNLNFLPLSSLPVSSFTNQTPPYQERQSYTEPPTHHLYPQIHSMKE
jgi:hypothetical protein